MSITSILGAGSGIDTGALIANLSAAAREGRDAQINAKAQRNEAKISALADLMATVSAFADQFGIDAQDATVTTAKLAEAFVAGFNQLRGLISSATAVGNGVRQSGALTGDSGVRAAAAKLASLPLATLGGGATATRLGDLGIATNRDGTLRIDRPALTAAIAADPDGVRAMLTGPTGVDAILSDLRATLGSETGVLGASKARYTRVSTTLAREREKAEAANATLVSRLTAQFTTMDRRVAAIKASQAYLTQQIDAWNGNNR